MNLPQVRKWPLEQSRSLSFSRKWQNTHSMVPLATLLFQHHSPLPLKTTNDNPRNRETPTFGLKSHSLTQPVRQALCYSECLRCRSKQNKWPRPKDAQESNRKATDRTINTDEWLNYELQSERHHGKGVRDQEHTRKKSHLQVCHFEIFLTYLSNNMYLFCVF